MSGLHRRTALLQTSAPGQSLGSPGVYLGSGPLGGYVSSVAAIGANDMFLRRFVPDEAVPITGLKVFVVAPDAGDPAVSAALYSSAGVRLATSGAVTGKVLSTNAWSPEIAFTTPYEVVPGTTYYTAISFAAATQTVRRLGVTSSAECAAFGTTLATDVLWGTVPTSHPCPDPTGATPTLVTACPIMLVIVDTDFTD